MADTQRTVAAILALLADNYTQEISAQDVRDAFVSWRNGSGRLSVGASQAVTIADTTNYVEVTAPTWTLGANALWFDESDGNGRLTYTGTPDVQTWIVATVSFTTATGSRLIHWRLGVNGTTVASTESQVFTQSNDQHQVTLATVSTLSSGDHVSLFVRNQSAIEDVTVARAQLQAITLPT